jgi:hypothetical protein
MDTWGVQKAATVATNDLPLFTHFRLMLGFDAPLLPVSNII